jgi:hypothetical protein
VHVRFGSKADIRDAKSHICFTLKSGHVLATAFTTSAMLAEALAGSSRKPNRCQPFDQQQDDRTVLSPEKQAQIARKRNKFRGDSAWSGG